MRTIRTSKNTAARSAFTLIELMVVVVIIAIAVAISTTAYLRAAGSSQTTTAKGYLQSLSTAIQFYYQEKRDYPLMRFADIDVNLNWPTTPVAIANDNQSVEALVYQLQYRSDAGKALTKLPQSVFRQFNSHSVRELTEQRPLYIVYDPWGNPIQYLRPRERYTGGVLDPSYPYSAQRLNNRVLLVSMGPDGVPGNVKNQNSPTWVDPADNNAYPNPTALGASDDIVVEVGATR